MSRYYENIKSTQHKNALSKNEPELNKEDEARLLGQIDRLKQKISQYIGHLNSELASLKEAKDEEKKSLALKIAALEKDKSFLQGELALLKEAKDEEKKSLSSKIASLEKAEAFLRGELSFLKKSAKDAVKNVVAPASTGKLSFEKILEFLKELSVSFQNTDLGAEKVVYLIPSSIMNSAQKTWITYLNDLSGQKAQREEKLYIVNTESLNGDEIEGGVLSAIREYQKQGYKALIATERRDAVESMLQNDVKALVFDRGVDLFLMLTCLRALYRNKFKALIRIYEMHTGIPYEGFLPSPDDKRSFEQFLKFLVFSIPEEKKEGYDIEIIRLKTKIKELLLSA